MSVSIRNSANRQSNNNTVFREVEEGQRPDEERSNFAEHVRRYNQFRDQRVMSFGDGAGAGPGGNTPRLRNTSIENRAAFNQSTSFRQQMPSVNEQE